MTNRGLFSLGPSGYYQHGYVFYLVWLLWPVWVCFPPCWVDMNSMAMFSMGPGWYDQHRSGPGWYDHYGYAFHLTSQLPHCKPILSQHATLVHDFAFQCLDVSCLSTILCLTGGWVAGVEWQIVERLVLLDSVFEYDKTLSWRPRIFL